MHNVCTMVDCANNVIIFENNNELRFYTLRREKGPKAESSKLDFANVAVVVIPHDSIRDEFDHKNDLFYF